MRNALIKQLIEQDNEDTYFLTADVGYNVLEPLQEKMGDRFINVGVAEQSMIGIASGLALSGKKVYTYTMCAFYLRALEQIRNDICYQNAPVTMIGVGTGYDYDYLGTTHFALEDESIIGSLKNIQVITFKNKEDVKNYLQIGFSLPTYLRLSKGGINETIEETRIVVTGGRYPKCGGSKDYFLKLENENKKH